VSTDLVLLLTGPNSISALSSSPIFLALSSFSHWVKPSSFSVSQRAAGFLDFSSPISSPALECRRAQPSRLQGDGRCLIPRARFGLPGAGTAPCSCSRFGCFVPADCLRIRCRRFFAPARSSFGRVVFPLKLSRCCSIFR
jgi:hypothetical protein